MDIITRIYFKSNISKSKGNNGEDNVVILPKNNKKVSTRMPE